MNTSIRSVSKYLLTNIVNFFYPPTCLVCNTLLSTLHPEVCSSCKKSIISDSKKRRRCRRCSINKKVGVCTCRTGWEHAFQSIYALCDFNETTRTVIHNIKYRGMKSTAVAMGELAPHILPDDYFDGYDCMIPVPLYFLRRFSRGYNQAEYFGKGVVNAIKDAPPLVTTILSRKRHTKTQTKLDKTARNKNLNKAFQINPSQKEFLQGKCCILLDDVVTTGATADCCATELLNSGAKEVKVLSIARA